MTVYTVVRSFKKVVSLHLIYLTIKKIKFYNYYCDGNASLCTSGFSSGAYWWGKRYEVWGEDDAGRCAFDFSSGACFVPASFAWEVFEPGLDFLTLTLHPTADFFPSAMSFSSFAFCSQWYAAEPIFALRAVNGHDVSRRKCTSSMGHFSMNSFWFQNSVLNLNSRLSFQEQLSFKLISTSPYEEIFSNTNILHIDEKSIQLFHKNNPGSKCL